MKAVIESREDSYLIHIYGSDELPCVTYAVEKIYYSEVGWRVDMMLNDLLEKKEETLCLTE